MNVLSLFDGISIARQALENIGAKVDKYYSSEIDKYALQISQKNWPDIIQLGDVKDIKICKGDFSGAGYLHRVPFCERIDLLIGGFPCTDLSISRNKREGLKGSQSRLFYEMVRIHKELKPKWFVYENVASMAKDQREIITNILGVEPIMIDAKLVSCQQRKRLFWTNIPNVTQPEDRHIYLKDILEDGEAVKEKAYCLTAHQKDFINDFIKRSQGNYVFKDKPIRIASLGKGGQGDRIYSIHGKSVCLSANGGGRGAKTGLYLITGAAKRTREGKGKVLEIRKDEKSNDLTTVQTDSLVVLKDYFRPLTPIETERCQSIPDNYTEGVSRTNRKKLCGNGFNCAVIEHILKNIL
jgi:DNA (cytosine-5)-methyltransferase 3A